MQYEQIQYDVDDPIATVTLNRPEALNALSMEIVRELGRIFDRFYRLGKSTRGTGLGLSIVRGLVEDMRGKIRAVSGGEQPGTRFEIQLPQASPEETPEEP